MHSLTSLVENIITFLYSSSRF